MSDFVIVLVTTLNKDEAQTIGMQLINAGVSPCINVISPCFSIYQWKGEVHRDEEALMIIKSEMGVVSTVTEIVEKAHSYDVPEILVVPIADLSDKYRAYLEGFLRT